MVILSSVQTKQVLSARDYFYEMPSKILGAKYVSKINLHLISQQQRTLHFYCN